MKKHEEESESAYPRKVTRRLVPAVVAAACLVVSCSSNDESTATNSTTTPEISPSTTAPSSTTANTTVDDTTAPDTTDSDTVADTTPDTTAATTVPDTAADSTLPDPADVVDLTDAERADQEVARTALISLAVFPDGWVEEPATEDGDDPDTDAFEAEFDECLDRHDDERVGDELEELAVTTGDFHPVDDDATTVSHEVVMATDESMAVAVMADVTIDGAESCLAGVVQSFYITIFADDPDLADITVGDVVVTRTEGDRSPDSTVGVMLEVPLTIGGDTVSQFLEILYQRDGRALSQLSFSSFGVPFDREGYDVLSEEVAVALARIGS
jgi:hypothetical protein